MKLNKLIIYLPVFFDFFIFNKNNKNKLILLNNSIIIIVNINNDLKKLYVNMNTNNIEFDYNIFNYKNIKIKNNFFMFLKLWNFFLFTKIKFKGKGYKINLFKKKKIINFFFNKSHVSIIKIKKLFLNKINKNKFILYSLNKNNLNKITKNIINIKKINLYTLRGLRNSKQIIFKRKGKKSSYI